MTALGALPAPGVSWATAQAGQGVGDEELAEVLDSAFPDGARGERVLVLVPDATRDVPMSRLLPLVLEALEGASAIDVMVALGTHPPMAPAAAQHWLGLDGATGAHPRRPPVRVANHAWADPDVLTVIGAITEDELAFIAGPYWHESLASDLVVRVNRAAVQADRVVVVGPTLPHEVAGFSGGAKYLFPGISGPEMIDVMHWLGALAGVLATIGVARAPVRALIDAAASLLPTPVSLVAVVTGAGEAGGTVVSGAYAGEHLSTWAASLKQATELHVRHTPGTYQRVISCARPIYGELWTAGKAMYKLEPVVADGGELVIYAPHLSRVSATHGPDIYDVGYHVLAYFLEQWDRFRHAPLAVLAHSTHVKGAGRYDRLTGREEPRVTVKLATRIPADDCARLNLGFEPLAAVAAEIAAPAPGTFVVPLAGEVLYRPSPESRARKSTSPSAEPSISDDARSG